MSLTVSGAGGQNAVLLQVLQQALAAQQADAGTTAGTSTGNTKPSTNSAAAIDLSGAKSVSSQLLSVITQIAGAGGPHGVHAAGGDGDGDADDGVASASQSSAVAVSDHDTSGPSPASGSAATTSLGALVTALQAYAENSAASGSSGAA